MGILRPHTNICVNGGSFCVAVVVVSLVLLNSVAADEKVTAKKQFSEYDIKAAYLINFVRYLEWPETAFQENSAPFILGIFGENPFGETLAQLAAEQKYGDRSIELKYADTIEELKSCHLLFFSSPYKGDLAEDLKALEEHPVLTVGEKKDFAEKGGIVNFILVETRVKFEINLKVARKKQLKISAQLLKVANNVIK